MKSNAAAFTSYTDSFNLWKHARNGSQYNKYNTQYNNNNTLF